LLIQLLENSQREKFHELYDKNISPSWTPIFRIAKPFPCTRGKNQTTIQKQFPIQLACARTIHRAQGLTLDKLAFDPSNIRTHGLVYTTLSRVKTMNSLFLIQKITQENFCVNKKVTTEMKRLLENQSWKLDYVQSSITCSNRLSIVTLNTCSLHAHLDDILQDEDLMSNMILCFQETRTNWPPSKKNFPNSILMQHTLSMVSFLV
jgi:hypothetical protein